MMSWDLEVTTVKAKNSLEGKKTHGDSSGSPCFLPDVASTELAPPGRLASQTCECLPDTERWSDSAEAVFDSSVGRPFSHRNTPPGLPACKARRVSLPITEPLDARLTKDMYVTKQWPGLAPELLGFEHSV